MAKFPRPKLYGQSTTRHQGCQGKLVNIRRNKKRQERPVHRGFILAIVAVFALVYIVFLGHRAEPAPIPATPPEVSVIHIPAGVLVEVTAYSNTPDQCDSTPNITASNIRVRDGIVALSRDIEQAMGLKFGDLVLLEPYGVFEFQDRMNKRIKCTVDIFMPERAQALSFGRQTGVLYPIGE